MGDPYPVEELGACLTHQRKRLLGKPWFVQVYIFTRVKRHLVQVDAGFGDPVTPDPKNVESPVLLPGMPTATLRAYPRYTVVAGKFDATVSLGITNSRMKN